MDKYEVLKKYYGYDNFRDRQEEVIDSILDNKDTIAILATGTGKSVCYQIPAIIKEGLTIVVSPLIALMLDQVRELNERNIKAGFLNSSLSFEEEKETLDKLKKNQLKIIYISPEGLLNEKYTKILLRLNLSQIIIDEAHCVSIWGIDFRPSYQNIKTFICKINKKITVACFTATANYKVITDIENIIGLKDTNIISSSFDRPNLYYETRYCKDKIKYLLEFLSENKECGIIYCLTRKRTQEIYSYLDKIGYQVTYYHGALDNDEKKKNQSDFITGKKKIIVATTAFGMGINKRDVRFVILYDIPQSIEDLTQQWGRASRDGKEGKCILLFNPKDLDTAEFLINSKSEHELPKIVEKELKSIKRKKLSNVIKLVETNKCIHQEISLYFGERLKYKCFNCSNCHKKYHNIT